MPDPHPPKDSRARLVLRLLASLAFVVAGVLHFVFPDKYEHVIPPGFPSPKMLVLISGLAEIAGGVGLWIRPLRRAAGWGLIALLIAVFPANVYMAVHPDYVANLTVGHWLLWARLPLQPVLIWWVWAVSLSRKRRAD